MESLAKFFNHDFDNGSFKLYDKNNNIIYWENLYRYSYKQKYDKNNNVIYHENSYGCWYKKEYDNNGKVTYYEDSEGIKQDNRTK